MSPEIRGSHWEQRKKLKLNYNEITQKELLLQKLNFVLIPGGIVRLGTPHPLPCRFEGNRANETPIRELEIQPFWICKYTVSNSQFEQFNPKRIRPQTSIGDLQPATNVTYLNALRYAEWLSDKYRLAFTLPAEPEWVYAAAPFGWEYPYQPGKFPDAAKTHTFVLGESEYKTIAVNNPQYGVNLWGLFHMGGNVQEYTLGSYYISIGQWGSITDGRYCIVKGGDFGHCPLGSGVQRRGVSDVSARSERVGFRLAHPDIRANDS